MSNNLSYLIFNLLKKIIHVFDCPDYFSWPPIIIVVLWEPCAGFARLLGICVYVCSGEHEEYCNKRCVNPDHL